MKAGNKRQKTREKAARKILTDASIGIAMAGPEILSFQKQVASQPKNFLKKLPAKKIGGPKIPRIDTGEIHPIRKETQEKILEKICARIETLSGGKISTKDIQEGIQTRCISRALSIVYATVYQDEEGRKRLEVIEHAGEEFQKEEGGTGVRAGGLCHSFLRQNGLTKKISHKEMAIELKGAFDEIFQKTRGALEEEGYEINDGYLKRMLATELFRKSGGRGSKAFQISNARAAARQFVERIQPEKEQIESIAMTLAMTNAANEFVRNQVSADLRQHLLENPLQPVYERGPSGNVLLHPQTGQQILNPNLPEKWRKSELNSPVETKFQKLSESPQKEEIGILLDTLRIPRKLNIPLQAALEQLEIKFPSLPDIIQKGLEAEKIRLAYEIAKAAHSVTYKLGIAIAADGRSGLSSPATKTMETLQNAVETLAIKGPESNTYWKTLQGSNPEETWKALENTFQEAKTQLILQKTSEEPTLPDVDSPKIQNSNFEPIPR